MTAPVRLAHEPSRSGRRSKTTGPGGSYRRTEHHFPHEGHEVSQNLILVGLHLAGITARLRHGPRDQEIATGPSVPVTLQASPARTTR